MRTESPIVQAPPTPYHDLNRVLADLVDSVQEIVGANFVGAYLQGSFAVGDFDLHSDVDFAIVIERELTADQVAALQAMHQRIYGSNSRWAQHLEGSYFPREVLRDASQCGGDLWYIDNGSQTLIRSSHCNTRVVRWVTREWGVALSGPSPETLLDPIPAGDLRREIFETMNTWGQEILDDPQQFSNRFYQAYLVLNYCRMLHDLQRGAVGSKLRGAEWAVNHLDTEWAELIDRSWARRSNAANTIHLLADHADFEETLRFIRFCMRESMRYAP